MSMAVNSGPDMMPDQHARMRAHTVPFPPAALLRQAARMTWRDWRAGELTILLLALVLAVTALTSVSFLADRMRQGLERDARQMIGADFIVRADHPVEPAFAERARALGLATASTAIFPSMVGAAASSAAGAAPVSRLAALKAVSSPYPLHGKVRIITSPGAPAHDAASIPAPGTVWIDPALLGALRLKIGEPLQVGRRSLIIAAVIDREPDRGFSFVSFSPRVMMRADDLGSTGLVTYGSRVTYRLLVAGPAPAVQRFAGWARVERGKLRGVALESLNSSQPQVRKTLDRAQHFLMLVALLSALLAAVAMAMSAHRYMRRHWDGCAVMRCLGVSQRMLCALFTIEFALVGLAGGIAGIVLGFAGHAALLIWLRQLIEVELPAPSGWPVLEGIGVGLMLLFGFALPPLLPLTRVPPVRVLRREWEEAGRSARFAYGIGVALFAALLIVAAGELKLGGIVAGGFAAGLLVFGAISRAVLRGLSWAARGKRAQGVGVGWRYALASLERRGAGSALQITALGIGLMCLLLLAMTRHDLIDGWRRSTPANAPNEFIIDIQPEQVDGVTRYLAQQGFGDQALAPMIRARLLAINGKPVNADTYKDDNARRLVEREFNLSYADTVPVDNQIIAGAWFGKSRTPQISIEQGIAKRLDIGLGDTLRFDVTGLPIEAKVTSVRKLDWGTFRVNFFMLMPRAALENMPASFITSFHLPAGGARAIDELVARYPNVTAIDTAPILAQIQRMLEQVIGAVQCLFAFTLAAGVLVLYAALAGTRDERMRESALLRALGASHRQVRAVQWAEFVVAGALAGLLAAVGAQSIGYVLAMQVFEFRLNFNPWLVPVGIACGIGCASVGGWLGLRSVLRRAAIQSLRDV